MKRKTYVAIMYNEPMTEQIDRRKVVSEKGIIQIQLPKPPVQPMPVGENLVDLSEIGVLEEKEDISRALQSLGYKTKIFNIDGDISRLLNFIKEEDPDVIFNLCESVDNNAIHEMHIAGIYELLHVQYTGSGPLTLGTALNKTRVKEILLYHGLPTPQFQIVKSHLRLNLNENLAFPLIVKPSREDASIGITTDSVVHSLADLRKRVKAIVEQYDQPALVEEYIDGRELNVAVMGNHKPEALPISEIDMSTLPEEYPRIITYNAKWLKGTPEYENTVGVCPAPLPSDVEKQVKQIALQAYRLIGCRDYARIDIRLNKKNQPYVLEVNPNPDISDDAGFARSARAAGMTFEDFVGRVVECALERMYVA